MGVSNRFILEQGPVIGTLAKGALDLALSKKSNKDRAPLVTPGPEVKLHVPPRSKELLAAYGRHVGADRSAYKGFVPPHLFPQWVFPLQAKTLEGIPYPMEKVLNGGCRMEIRAPLPANEPLIVSGRLENIDDNGRRALIHARATTGTKSAPEALIVDMYAVVPLRSKEKKKGPKKDKPRVPVNVQEIAYWRIGSKAGLDFAKLTGDFNPVHWIPPYARAMGFRNVILHGFSTMARAYEGVVRSSLQGRPFRMRTFDVKFTRPLILPHEVGLYLDENQGVYVGDAPGGPAYLVGSYGADS